MGEPVIYTRVAEQQLWLSRGILRSPVSGL